MPFSLTSILAAACLASAVQKDISLLKLTLQSEATELSSYNGSQVIPYYGALAVASGDELFPILSGDQRYDSVPFSINKGVLSLVVLSDESSKSAIKSQPIIIKGLKEFFEFHAISETPRYADQQPKWELHNGVLQLKLGGVQLMACLGDVSPEVAFFTIFPKGQPRSSKSECFPTSIQAETFIVSDMLHQVPPE